VSKSEKAFRTITEVAEIIDLPAHVLRFWESKFKYIKPMKRGGGRRYYRPEDINLLFGIKHLLYSEGLTIKGAQKLIQTTGVKAIANFSSEKPVSENLATTRFKSKSFPLNKVAETPKINLSLNSNLSFTSKKINREKLATILVTLEEICNNIKTRSIKKIVA
jgi:DNA-binding transcriptional MerR regulator